MTKRIALALFDALSPLGAACLVVLVATPQAHAYVDPSVMTYTIQAVAGVAVALSAVLGVALRRTRKVLVRILHIDENANKVVEPNVEAVGYPDDVKVSEDKLCEADAYAKKDKIRLEKGAEPRRLSWRQRFARSIICSGFFVLTVFIAAPLEIVAASYDSLNFDFFNALPIVVGAGLVAIFALSLSLSLMRGKLFDFLMTTIVALGVCCYIQSLLLNGPLPVADGSSLDLSKFKRITAISTVVWLFIIVAFVVLNARKRSICRPLLLGICGCLIVMQTASLVSIGADQQAYIEQHGKKSVMTTDGINEVSAKDNVIVFVLDFFDTRLLRDYILENDPAILDEFTGFTWFRNATGSMIPTRYGVPFLLTGEMPRDDDTAEEYTEERYNRSTFIKDIADQGYTVDLYSDSLLTNKLDEYADNIITADNLEMNAPELLLALGKMSLYRECPWILKPLFWFYTDELNQSAISSSLDPYVIDDAAYGDKLRSQGLATNNTEKSFRFIHLMGAHYPFTMDAEGHRTTEETDQQTQGRGVLGIVGDYLKQLKELGVYDQATIIVTSDHGYFYLTDEPLDRPISPILLVKPSEAPGEAKEPLKISDVPTGHLDFPATVIDAVGGDASAYGPTVFDIKDEPRPRFYWTTTSNGREDLDWVEYEIDGNALDLNDWKLTGKTIPILPENER